MSYKLSIIIPAYNEEDNIPVIYSRIEKLAPQIDGKINIIFVDDGSTDRTLNILRDLHKKDKSVSYISLARNFGHQIALKAGLNFAGGDGIVVLDADLQDPPEIIPQMIEKWKEGYQVIYAQRIKREGDTFLKKLTAHFFYRFLNYLSEVKIPLDTGDCCFMDKKVVKTLQKMKEHSPYIRGLRTWVGFKQTSISFAREKRFEGEAKYNFKKSLALAMDGIFSLSKRPLKLSIYLGFLCACFAIVMSCLVVYWRLTQPEARLTGFAINTISMFFIASVQLFVVGILGEYLGRIYDEVKGRPIYTVDEVCGFENFDEDR